MSSQRSLAEPVKIPFSLGPIGCRLTGLIADGGSWLPVLVTLWQGLSEVGCPQKQSLRQGLGAGVYLREGFMKQEEGSGGLLQATSKGIVPRKGGGLRALERAVSSMSCAGTGVQAGAGRLEQTWGVCGAESSRVMWATGQTLDPEWLWHAFHEASESIRDRPPSHHT